MAIPVAAEIEHYLFEPEDASLPDFVVLEFSGQEAISQLTKFEIKLLCSEPALDFSGLLNKRAALRIWCWQNADYGRVYHGIISKFEQIGQDEDYAIYRAVMVPLLWRLTLSYQSRIFQDMTVPEIIEDVFMGADFQPDDYRISLESTYDVLDQPPREFCVQYRESDFNFISRLMEEEGIFYFFEYGDDKEVLVIADAAAIHQETVPLNEIGYEEPSGMQDPEAEYIHPLNYSESVLPTEIALKDFNFDTPQADLLASSQIQEDESYMVYDYPGRFGFLDRGTEVARIRNEEVETGRKAIWGGSNCRSFCAGYRFTLTSHPRSDLQGDYILIRVSHHGVQTGPLATESHISYENQFECIPADTPFRPLRLTRKPRVQGTQTAIVVGPEGEEIYVDEKGRIKIQFHWDLEGGYDENSSCWVRVSQTWAGANWGAMFIPRIGQEVIVDFLEGDPDKPLVIGSVYNGDNQPPYTLPDDMTKSTIKSYSSKGGEGFNEIRFEDKKGEEEIFIHAEKNMDLRVGSNRRTAIGNDIHLKVKRDRLEEIERHNQVTIGQDEVKEIGNDHHFTVKGKQAIKAEMSRSVTVQENVVEDFKANQSTKIGQNYYLSAGTNIVIESGLNITFKVGGNSIAFTTAGIFISGNMLYLNSGSGATTAMAGGLIQPKSPEAPQEAGTAHPGTESPPWHREPSDDEAAGEGEETASIEIALVDENGNPVPGEPYSVVLPDGSVAEGITGQDGTATIRGFSPPGDCQVSFTNLDAGAWEKTQTEE